MPGPGAIRGRIYRVSRPAVTCPIVPACLEGQVHNVGTVAGQMITHIQEPTRLGSYGSTQPVSLKLQANNC
jgi:hypothetical protein